MANRNVEWNTYRTVEKEILNVIYTALSPNYNVPVGRFGLRIARELRASAGRRLKTHIYEKLKL